ncbi:MAG: hypothetical protein SVK54_01965 [candidate division WOR-3 bacterium]|nr:hypothetical protein [candidate division WOR-3 bacterium]
MKRARIDKQGYFYLITVKGQRKNPLFFSNDDRGAFLNILKKVLDDTDISLFAYSITRIEYQLLVYRHNTPLKTFMSKLETAYAIYFNKKYETVGYVHQDRYNSLIILNDEYNVPRVINSIHYLPQEEGLIDDFKEYPFSSISFYRGRKDYIPQIRRYVYDRRMQAMDYDIYEDAIGTRKEYLALLKRKPGRKKGKGYERRDTVFFEKLDVLLKEHGLTEDVFYRWRSDREKKRLKKLVEALNRIGFTQSYIGRQLGLSHTTINNMTNYK